MSRSIGNRRRRTKERGIDLRGPYTIEDYFALPDDGKRYELLDGELVMTPSPRDAHQTVVFNLATILRAHVKPKKLGKVWICPFDVVLRPRSVCQPDILYVSARRMTKVLKDEIIKGAPDLAIEVASPGRRRYDRVVKRRIYARSGVAHLWLVEPKERIIEELILDPRKRRYEEGDMVEYGDKVFIPEIFPDLKIKLAQVFDLT